MRATKSKALRRAAKLYTDGKNVVLPMEETKKYKQRFMGFKEVDSPNTESVIENADGTSAIPDTKKIMVPDIMTIECITKKHDPHSTRGIYLALKKSYSRAGRFASVKRLKRVRA